MKLYKFNKKKLDFEIVNLRNYKMLFFIILITLFITLISTTRLRQDNILKDKLLEEKVERLKVINTPLRKETYVEDLYKNIGFKLTNYQYLQFSKLALKYRDLIEDKKIPATLVWWTAYKESRFNIKAYNNTSTAKGMFQFLDGTWNGVCKLSGKNNKNRCDEKKQIEVMLIYLNYLYNKHGSWEKSMIEYHGGNYQYPITFLFK